MKNLISKAGPTRRVALLLLLTLLPVLAQTVYLSRLPVTIPNGESLTDVINLRDQPVVAIQMPSAWTTADLTFQGSNDGTNFFDVYTLDGDEYTVAAAASRYIVLSPFEFQWARYIKIRSGTSASPVNQGATRTLVVVTRRVL